MPADERSSRETLALAGAELDGARSRLEMLLRTLSAAPNPLERAEELRELRGFAQDSDLALTAVERMASLPSSVGADLLYDVWTGTPARTRATALAEQLLYSRDVRGRASAALAVAMDLRRAEKCEDVAALLERVKAQGDARSLRPLNPYTKAKPGCGTNGKGDCNACVRRSRQLLEAIEAARMRESPKFGVGPGEPTSSGATGAGASEPAAPAKPAATRSTQKVPAGASTASPRRKKTSTRPSSSRPAPRR
jgi:hypothetical protein